MNSRKTIANLVTVNASVADIDVCTMDNINVSTATVGGLTANNSFYPPRVTTAEKTALSVNQGAVVYDTDEEKLYSYDGSAWNVAAGATFDPASLQAYLNTLLLIPQSDTTISSGWTVDYNTADVSFSSGVITFNTAGTYSVFFVGGVHYASTNGSPHFALVSSTASKCRTIGVNATSNSNSFTLHIVSPFSVAETYTLKYYSGTTGTYLRYSDSLRVKRGSNAR